MKILWGWVGFATYWNMTGAERLYPGFGWLVIFLLAMSFHSGAPFWLKGSKWGCWGHMEIPGTLRKKFDMPGIN